MKRKLTQWWNDWGRLDLLLLTMAGLSAVVYLDFRYSHPANNDPWLEFWSNVTTDLFFAWLTIRVIDALIKRRDHREEVRQTLAGNLNYTLGIIQVFLPKVYQHDLGRLKDELYWAEKRLPKRTHFLVTKEVQKLKIAYEELRSLIEYSDKLTTARQHQVSCQRKVQNKLRELRKLREAFNSEVNKLEEESSVKSPKDKAMKARDLIDKNRTILSNHEVSELEYRLSELDKQIEKAGDDHDHYLRWPHLHGLYGNDIAYDDELRYLLEDLQELSDPNYLLLTQRLQVCRSHLGSASYPVALLDILQAQLDAVEKLIKAHEQVELISKKAIKALGAARDDILEETTFD